MAVARPAELRPRQDDRREASAEAAPEILRGALKNGDPAVLGEQLEEVATAIRAELESMGLSGVSD